MRIPDTKGKRRARIEIIPLIDIMFFLLATFMMVSMSMIESQGIKVKLPVAETTTSQDLNKSMLTISINAAGDILVDKKKTEITDLRSKLADYKNNSDDPRVLINADEAARWQSVMKAMDETRAAGISKVAILTQKPEK